MVGCVVVADGRIVGEGYHESAGQPHAEVLALQDAGDAARGADVYVTLEPCNHTGRTPPCTEALIDAGIASVLIGMADPNPEVEGGGAARLAAAGVDVCLAEDPSPCESLNEPWLKWARTGRPFVQVKVAVSLDGHASAQSGAKTVISGTGGRSVTMRLRAAADAVLVGAETALIDQPRLTARDADDRDTDRQPLRIVWGRTGVPDLDLFHDALGPAIALLPRADPPYASARPQDAEVLQYEDADDPLSALDALGSRGIVRLLVEAGPALLTALLKAGAVDELVLVHGGGFAAASAPPLFVGESPGGTTWLERSLSAIEAGVVDEDAITVWRPKRPPE